MTLDALIMFAGAIVAALPFLGFPRNVLEVLQFLAGVSIFLLGVSVRRQLYQKKPDSAPSATTSEGQ